MSTDHGEGGRPPPLPLPELLEILADELDECAPDLAREARNRAKGARRRKHNAEDESGSL